VRPSPVSPVGTLDPPSALTVTMTQEQTVEYEKKPCALCNDTGFVMVFGEDEIATNRPRRRHVRRSHCFLPGHQRSLVGSQPARHLSSCFRDRPPALGSLRGCSDS
jgi:hypothetical protein